MDTEAVALKEKGASIILFDEDRMSKQPDWLQAFLFYRECGLHQEGIVEQSEPYPPPMYSREQLHEADCFATRAVAAWARGAHGDVTVSPQLIQEKLAVVEGPHRAMTVGQLRACTAMIKK